MGRPVYYFTDGKEFGGAESALLLLIEHIDHQAWEPTLLYDGSRALEPVANRARELGAKIRPVPSMPLGLAGASRVPMVAGMLRRERPAVFHAHMSWPLAAKYALAGAVLARVPAIVATVQLYPDFPIDLSNRLQERLLATRVHQYIAVSQDIADRLVETLGWPRHKIDVIRNAVALEREQRPVARSLRLQLAGDRNRRVVLSTARLTTQKGLDVLLRAAVQLPEVRVVLAGEGPEREGLEAEARSLGIRDRVLFLGRREDVPDLLGASDVFVLPSLYEGTSLSVLEAMAAGCPVVASAIPGTDELIWDGESGLLVPPADADALAAALRRVLDEPLLRENLRLAARQRVERCFSASAAARRVTRLYEALLETDR